jgi:hypothetical protein
MGAHYGIFSIIVVERWSGELHIDWSLDSDNSGWLGGFSIDLGGCERL